MYKIDPTSQAHKLESPSGAPQPGPQRDGSPVPAGAPAAVTPDFTETLFENLWPCEILAQVIRDHRDVLADGAATASFPLRAALREIVRYYDDNNLQTCLINIDVAFARTLDQEVR